jgi:predicted phage terminase large subunit-like protein
MTDSPELLNAVLRRDLAAFIEKTFSTMSNAPFSSNWHIDAMAHQLKQVADGNTRRLIINVPPRHLKSISASVAFPAWLLGHNPGAKIVCASYGDKLASEFSLQTRNVMSSEWYQAAFPGTVLSTEKFTESYFATTAHGSRRAVSLGGPLTGFGGDHFVIDDPMKAGDVHSEVERQRVKDWFGQTLLSRQDQPTKSAIILVMQRLHEDDLTGHLLAQGGWTHLCIPAEAPYDLTHQTGPEVADTYTFKAGSVIDPNRIPKKELDGLRHGMGNRDYSALYLQSPTPAGGNLFDWSWFKFYHPADLEKVKIDFVFQSWDVASSEGDRADYSVCTTWGVSGIDQFYLLDVHRMRCLFPDLVRRARQLFDSRHADAVLVETVGSGTPFYQELADSLKRRVCRYTPRQSKTVRAEAITPILENGKVYLPRQASWLEALRAELITFPHGKNDDQVDSLVQFLKHAKALIKHVRQFGLARNGGDALKLPAMGPTVTVKTIGPRRLRHDLAEIASHAHQHLGS